MRKEFDIGKIPPAPVTYINCSVCKELYAIDARELNSYFNTDICPCCKQAILYARTLMENQGD